VSRPSEENCTGRKSAKRYAARVSLEIKLGDGAESIVISDHVSSLTATDRAQGWVASDVAIKLGAWSGRYGANFQLLDFSSFLKRLRPLSESLRGEAMLFDRRLSRPHDEG
jgi:hypothetical protein